MANKDNRLGAPTEGLGQNVTFQTATGRSSQQQTVGRRGPNVGMEGSGGARLTSRPIEIPDVVSEGARTMKALQAIGSEILKPHIERQRDEAYLRGMRRAATGEAIKEIVDEQPWYSKVFGDTPMIEGARAWTSMERTNSAMQGIEADMPELRKLPPERVQQLLAQRAQELGNSGDANTDLLVTQSFMKAMPGFLKAHTKEHLGYQQETYARASMGAQQGAGALLQTLMSLPLSDKLDDTKGMDELMAGAATYRGRGEQREAQINFIQAFAQAPGLPLETHQKMTTASILNMVGGGNLHAYNTLDAAGVLADLGPENEKRIREAADRAENKMRANMPSAMINQLADIKAISARGDSEEYLGDLMKRVGQFNANWAQMTGARDPFLKGETQAQLQTSLMAGIFDARKKAFEASQRASSARSGSPEKLEQRGLAAAAAAVLIADGVSLITLGKEEKLDAWVLINEDQKTAPTIKVTQGSMGNFDERTRDRIVAFATAALDSSNADQWELVYREDFLPLVEAHPEKREGIALAYLDRGSSVGSDIMGVMSKYHKLQRLDMDPIAKQAAFLVAKTQPIRKGNPGEGEIELTKVIKDDLDPWYWFETLDPRFHAQLAQQLAPSMSGVDKASAEAALAVAKSQGLEFVGGMFYNNPPGKSFIADTLIVANSGGTVLKEDTIKPLLGDFLKLQGKLVGIKPSTMSLIGGVKNGKAVIHVIGQLDNGHPYLDTVEPEEFSRHVFESYQGRSTMRTRKEEADYQESVLRRQMRGRAPTTPPVVWPPANATTMPIPGNFTGEGELFTDR